MILTIDKSKKIARNLSDAFFNMGYIARGATPTEALSEISNRYRAAVITSPEALPDAADFIKRIRSYNESIPIFTFECDFAIKNPQLFDMVLKKNAYAPKILASIVDYAEAMNLPIPGQYTLAGIDASADLSTPVYFWTGLPFTKTECMIIRYLIRAYPTPVSADEILRYAYRPSKLPDASNIRTHISIINKKFMKIDNKRLITLIHGSGYAILTPELLEVK